MTVSEQRELGLVIFYPMHGGGGGILGGSHVFHREQRGVSVIANRVLIGDYRKLTVNKGGVSKILQGLIGGSGKFHCDATKSSNSLSLPSVRINKPFKMANFSSNETR